MRYLWITFLAVGSLLWGQPTPNTYILTVQHSGSMWTLYSLHTMTNRRICDCNHNRFEARKLIRDWHKFYKYEGKIDDTLSPIYFSHSADRFRLAKLSQKPKTDKLLIVLRNFKECFLSLKHTPEAVINTLNSRRRDVFLTNLVNNLRLYDKWDPKNRLLIYYEDLMTHPAETFEKMLLWLGNDVDLAKNYMQNYDDHRAHCFQLYKNKFNSGIGNTKSQGKLIAHTKDIDQNTLKKLDSLFRHRYPDLWEYFKRFES